jgi:hypothetical protein
MSRIRIWISVISIGLFASAAAAQDRVTYRDRAGKAPRTVSGKIEAESLAGIKIANRTIPIADVVDVQYDVPGAIKLDYPRRLSGTSNIASPC